MNEIFRWGLVLYHENLYYYGMIGIFYPLRFSFFQYRKCLEGKILV
jgi:hypothetical protein